MISFDEYNDDYDDKVNSKTDVWFGVVRCYTDV